MTDYIDASTYTPPDIGKAFSNGVDIANKLQTNKLLQLEQQQRQVNLQNAQWEQQAGQLIAQHSPYGNADYTSMFSDPNFDSNPAYAAKVMARFKEGSQPTEVKIQDPNNPNNFTTKTMTADDAMVARYANSGTAHKDFGKIYDQLAASRNVINNIISDPQLTEQKLNEHAADAVANGVPAADVVGVLKDAPKPDANGIIDRSFAIPHAKVIGNHINFMQKEARERVNPIVDNAPDVGNTNVNVNPLEMAGLDASVKRGTETLNDLQKNVENSQNSARAYGEVINELKNVSTGGAAPLVQKYGSLFSQIGIDPAGFAQASNKLAYIQKELEQGKNNALGSHSTDMARLSADIANGTITTPEQALIRLAEQNQAYALENPLKQKALHDAYGSQPNPVQADNFISKYQDVRSPDAIIFTSLPADKRANYYDNLSDDQKQKLKIDLSKMKNFSVNGKNINLLKYIGQ